MICIEINCDIFTHVFFRTMVLSLLCLGEDFWQIFPENYRKLKKVGPSEGVPCDPFGLANDFCSFFSFHFSDGFEGGGGP